MTRDDANLYVNFALHAILGRLREADVLMRFALPHIRRVADRLSRDFPIEPKPLYRGVLLGPRESMTLDPRYTFLSWSEDRDVARWFADPLSTVSQYVALAKPGCRGHIFEYDKGAPRPRILFHHSWVIAFGGITEFSMLARLHPFMGDEGARQIYWSLRTQQEVITEPTELPKPQRFEDVPGELRHTLDQRLSPPEMQA